MAILHKTILSLPDVTIKGAFVSPVNGISIDTRSLNAGEIFVAFNGAQVDGHDFILKAISRGASAVMASTSWDGCEHWDAPIPLIMAKDPVIALADLANAHRKRFDIPVIAITGTNGKTSTKNLLTHLLSQQFVTLSTDGNFNNHIGLPITLLNLDETHEFAVIEMGASQKGDIEYLCNIAQPTQGLITNISLAHAEFFNDLDTIEATKGELFEYLNAHNGEIFVNADDDRVAGLGHSSQKPVRFSFSHPADYTFSLAGPDHLGCYDLLFTEDEVHLPHPGKVLALNAAAASTIAHYNGITNQQIKQALENYSGEAGRMQHISIQDVSFYNDAYNANPASVEAGLETIAAMQSAGHKILVFADMLELGAQSQALHLTAAEQMLAVGFDFIILVGREVSVISEHLKEQGFSSFYYNVDKAPAIQRLLQELNTGDLVYLKGSRSMQLETFIHAYKEQN